MDHICRALDLGYYRNDMVKESFTKVFGLSNKKFRDTLLPLPEDAVKNKYWSKSLFSLLADAKHLSEKTIGERWVRRAGET